MSNGLNALNEPLALSVAGAYLADAGQRWPEKAALQFGDETISYARLWSLSRRAAAAFRRRGVEPGVRVGVLLPNGPHHVVLSFGVFIAGGCVVNLSSEAALKELELQIRDTEVELLVTATSGPTNDKVRGLLDEGVGLRALVLCDVDDKVVRMETPLAQDWRHGDVEVADLGTFLTSGADGEDWAPPQLDDLALIQFTGGTTGSPKGAMLRHRNLSAAIELTGRWLGPVLCEDDRRLSLALPLSHIFGFYTLATCIATGTPVLLHRRFDPLEVIAQIERERVTIMFGVPTMYAAMVASGRLMPDRITSLKLCGVGGAPLSQHLSRSFHGATGLLLREGYGLSETCANGAWQPIFQEPKPDATGLPMPLTTIEVVDLETGQRVLPPGELGEVCITGPQVMAGYWNRPEETAWAFRGGRFHTGDIGRLDEDGYLALIDRKKDMILTGGFNVFPSTVEAALCEHPTILEAAVVGVENEFMGQVVKAYLRRCPGVEPCTHDRLLAFLTTRLAPFEMPLMIEWRDELPKTYVGKLARNRLKADGQPDGA